MRCYHQTHAFYCGVDLHARTMYLCVFNHTGQKLLHKEVPSDPAALLEALAPYRARRHAEDRVHLRSGHAGLNQLEVGLVDAMRTP
jgi:hypothetical protein